MSAHIRKNSCELFLSDGCTATSAGGNPKMSQPWPTSTCVSFRVSRRKARSASGFLLLMTECAPVIIIVLALKKGDCCRKTPNQCPMAARAGSLSEYTRHSAVRFQIVKRSAWIDRTCFHKTQWVLPLVLDIKGTFTPGSYSDLATGLAVHILRRQAAQRLGPREYRVKVVHYKIKSLGRGVRLADR